ncbi:unnamed protein product [Rhizophagus irregularis]|uniref:6-phosphogluconate dehydrogenase C-terminal domain-containing protein n=1 Tax=Rhizophagus irregularis TaxID=588596 RepID=A0A916EDD0_9GLOM|nr:unnamed protein product [Rhizophagus irregularis]
MLNCELDSFLIDITKDIVRFKDDDGSPLVEKIKDTANQTAISSFNFGVPVTLIGEAVYSCTLLSLKDECVCASKILPEPKNKKFEKDKDLFVKQLGQALYYASKLISYAQGFMLMHKATKDHNWDLNII